MQVTFVTALYLGDLVTALHAELDRIERAHQLQAGRVQREFPNTLTARFDPSTLEPIVLHLLHPDALSVREAHHLLPETPMGTDAFRRAV